MKIAFIGLGLMGRPMAGHLLAAGHQVAVHDRDPASVALLAGQGATVAPHAAGAAQGAELVFTCLPGPAEVEAIALGTDGLLHAMEPGSAWFDFTTNSPALIRSLHATFQARGVHLLDAPISGGPRGAASRRLVFWVGGDRAVFDRHRDVLACMGVDPMHVGAIGCGAVTKLAHNCANFTVQAVLAEAFTLGVKAGMDPLVLFGALRQGTLGRSRTFDRLAEQFLPGAYDPPDFALKWAQKDMRLAAALADENDVPLPMAQLLGQRMAEAMERGWGERDARVVLALQEERAGVSVRVGVQDLQAVLHGGSPPQGT